MVYWFWLARRKERLGAPAGSSQNDSAQEKDATVDILQETRKDPTITSPTEPTPNFMRKTVEETAEFACSPSDGIAPGARALQKENSLKGSDLILIPEGAKPPWQTIFGKDYIAVQGLGKLSDQGLLGICSGTDEFVAVRVGPEGKGNRAFTLRPSSYLKELEPNSGIAIPYWGVPLAERLHPIATDAAKPSRPMGKPSISPTGKTNSAHAAMSSPTTSPDRVRNEKHFEHRPESRTVGWPSHQMDSR